MKKNKPIPNHLIIKVSSRCNIACSYCHWFRDPEVLNQPKKISKEGIELLHQKLYNLITFYKLKSFSVVLHGGEPLLLGKKTFLELCNTLKSIEADTNCKIDIGLTTNGLLIDKDWCKILNEYKVKACLSIDGLQKDHDKNRIDFNGTGTFEKVMSKIKLLQENYFGGLNILSVADETANPSEILNLFIINLQAKSIDFLIPNFNHDDIECGTKLPEISKFYTSLFDTWYDNYSTSNTFIRCVESFVSALLGRQAILSGVGFSPMTTITLLPDGSLEPHDVLRISGSEQTKTNLNISKNEIYDILDNEVWNEAYSASISVPDKCMQCEFLNVCGGGYLIHRFSKSNRYNNPSIYCEELKEIYKHILNRITADMFVIDENESLPVTAHLQ